MKPNVYFNELSIEFSNQYQNKFKDVFYFYKKHATDENSLIRKLHLGYTAMRPKAFDFVADKFPWLEEFRKKYQLTKKLNFLETNGIHKNKFEPHIDGLLNDPRVMFNFPILNCTTETVTSWVEPLESVTPIYAAENYSTNKRIAGATPHLPKNTKYKVLKSHSFTDRASLFRSNVYHMVENNSNRDEYRIMMHWWFPPNIDWEQANDIFKNCI